MKTKTLIFAIIFVSISVFAQNTGTGIPPFGSFSGGTIYDAINNQNLNVHISLPFMSLAGRGTNFSFGEINDSQIWMPVTSGGATSWSPVVDNSGNPTWGWQAASPTGNIAYTLTATGGTCDVIIPPGSHVTVPLYRRNNWIYTDIQGTRHRFPTVDLTDACINNTVVPQATAGFSATGYASDPSGLFLTGSTVTSFPSGFTPLGPVNGVVTDANGVQHYGVSWEGYVEDTNGNYISTTSTSSGHVWTDTTGTNALTVVPASGSVQYKDRNGNVVVTVNLQTLNIKTNFGCSSIAEYSGTATVPSSISLSDGRSFSFSYESTPGSSGFFTGRLNTVTLPDGGSYEYDYLGANDGVNCADGSTMSLARKISDGISTSTWTFTRSGSTTTVTYPQLAYDAAGNSVVFGFDGNGHETSRKVYQGAVASGSLLRTVNTTWAANGTPATSVNILEDGSTQAETDTTYDSNGVLQAASYYDFGAGTRGPLIKTISYSYLAGANTNYAAPRNLIILPSEIQLKDGNGAVRNRVHFNYDENGALTSCPAGVVQHDDVNYGCNFIYRGNPTSVLTYKDPVTPANPVIRSSTFDIFGNQLVIKLNGVQQQSVTFSTATNYSYLDSITSGPSNGPQLTKSFAYNNSLGQLASTTDENGQITQYGYDTLGRLSAVTRPDQAQILYGYDVPNRKTTVTTPVDATHNMQQVTASDALGRVLNTTLEDGAGNVAMVLQNQYDALGRLSSYSNPYTGDSSSFFTTTQFDALGRVTKTALPDGKQSTYSYSLQSAVFTDPGGKQIRHKADALDRLVEVDQPDPASTGGTNATASVTITGAMQSVIGAGSTLGLPATRIQTSGGTSNIKYFFSVPEASQNGVVYSFSVMVKNQGSTAVKLAGNFVDGPVVQPGTTQSISFSGAGDGFDLAQLLFETLNVGDPIDVIAFAPSITKGSNGVNLIPTTSQNFGSGWSAWNGAVATITQGQTIPATRIQTSGGTSNIKYFFSAPGASQNGVSYSFSLTLKNQGLAAVKLAGNFVDGPIIQPGATQSVRFAGIGDGFDLAQLLFETVNVGDAIDVIAFVPCITKGSDGVNLVPTASQNFASGWSSWNGAVATVTQGQIVPATRIQTTGGTSNFKYFFSAAGGPSQNGAPYAFSITLRNQGQAAVKLSGNFVDGPVIQPGMMQNVNFSGNGDGFDIPQLLLETLSPGDAIDVIAFAPSIVKLSDGTNLIPSASQNFSSGWSTWNGSMVTLTQGRTDLGTSDTIYDAGTAALTLGGFTATACFGSSTSSSCSGQPVNTNPSAVASVLAQALNVSTSPATAVASGSTINLTWKTPGPNTTSVGALNSTSDNPGVFSPPSFASLATSFGGGSVSFANATVTTYTFNAMDQITGINQGTQTRTASYDALGRLTSHTTPEAGTVSFQYNDLNLMTQRTDSRSVVTNYTYDGLSRVIGTSYTIPNGSSVTPMPNVCDPAGGSTPTAAVCRYYDQGGSAAFALGRLTTEVDSSGSEAYSYDQLGQTIQRRKIINGANNGNAFVTQYQYNLSGEVTQVQYPSGRQVRQAFDTLGRLISISDVTTTYASGFGYNTAQQLTGFNFGNGITSSYGYSTDGRLQLKSLQYSNNAQALLNLSYGYSQNGGNNGQITSITDNIDNGRSTSYIYDVLGRLKQAYTVGSTNYPKWDLAFAFDQYGNRTNETPLPDTSPNASVPSNSISVNSATNQISSAGYAYDLSGNMTNDGVNAIAYDAENQVSSTAFNGVSTSYVSDNAGLRVRKCQPNCSNPSSSTVYIFSGSHPIAEYDNGAAVGSPSREYIFSPAGLLATIDFGGTKYQIRDHLSPRITTDSTGNIVGQQGHFPFGEQWYSANTVSKMRFTNYENDPESGNDYAMARYYISRLCRFSSPDPLGGSMLNPQSFNRYSYVNNDPINNIDPLGLTTTCNLSVALQGGILSPQRLNDFTKELNRIFGTGGADIHINVVTSGPADLTLNLHFNPVSLSDSNIGQFGFTPPAQTPGNYSELYNNRIDAIGPTTDLYHAGWPYASVGKEGYGQGLIYGRVAAHEMAAHALLGYFHSGPEDANRGFLGSGPISNADLFKLGTRPNSTFSFSPSQGALLHALCIVRTQKFDVLPGGFSPISLVPNLRDFTADWIWAIFGSGGGQTTTCTESFNGGPPHPC